MQFSAARDHMASLSKVLCTVCGDSIWRDRGRVNENMKLRHNSYCSRACESLYKTKKRSLFCDNPGCRKEFLRVPNDILVRNYCSQSCAAHVNNQKFPKRGRGFRICGYSLCALRFIGKTRYCSHICYAASRKKHTTEELIGKLRQVNGEFGRVPAKREVKSLAGACIHAFSSWNNALFAAGLVPNRSHNQRMYKRVNTRAKDGHQCDSISEAIVDNWLADHAIEHARDVLYPTTHHKADWNIGKIFVEYFGLAKDSPRYDRAIKRKRNLCRAHHIQLIEIYPEDLYPNIALEHKLNGLLKDI